MSNYVFSATVGFYDIGVTVTHECQIRPERNVVTRSSFDIGTTDHDFDLGFRFFKVMNQITDNSGFESEMAGQADPVGIFDPVIAVIKRIADPFDPNSVLVLPLNRFVDIAVFRVAQPQI